MTNEELEQKIEELTQSVNSVRDRIENVISQLNTRHDKLGDYLHKQWALTDERFTNLLDQLNDKMPDLYDRVEALEKAREHQ
jgi:hypothetical protein